MKRELLVFCWIFVMVTGAFLRFDDLAKRPMHADEATGARITARRMEADGGRFDPKHYHGPVLHDAAVVICMIRGEKDWKHMTKHTLRLLPAAAGALLLLAPLLWRRRCGDVAALMAAAFLATSPLLVYYSRMFIHEMPLTLFGVLALGMFFIGPRWVAAGVLIGLMFATKETFAISVIAWSGAAMVLLWENRRTLDVDGVRRFVAENRRGLALFPLFALLVSMVFYTDGFRHLQGAVDAVKTFFVYETVGGHDKPFGYYFHLLAVPFKSAGLRWFGTPVVVLALAAYASTFRKGEMKGRKVIRFMAYAALGHLLIYSLIAYKTPWLACLPWAHVCLLAGFAFAGFASRPLCMKCGLIAVAAVAVWTQVQQTRLANGRLAADGRNPFAYVPTRHDLEKVGPWLMKLREVAPDRSLEPIAVVGVDYWPLPWYLRDFDKIGYWKEPTPEMKSMPIVFGMPETSEKLVEALGESHMPLPRGLRADVPMYLFVRKDIWNHWMEIDTE